MMLHDARQGVHCDGSARWCSRVAAPVAAVAAPSVVAVAFAAASRVPVVLLLLLPLVLLPLAVRRNGKLCYEKKIERE